MLFANNVDRNIQRMNNIMVYLFNMDTGKRNGNTATEIFSHTTVFKILCSRT